MIIGPGVKIEEKFKFNGIKKENYIIQTLDTYFTSYPSKVIFVFSDKEKVKDINFLKEIKVIDHCNSRVYFLKVYNDKIMRVEKYIEIKVDFKHDFDYHISKFKGLMKIKDFKTYRNKLALKNLNELETFINKISNIINVDSKIILKYFGKEYKLYNIEDDINIKCQIDLGNYMLKIIYKEINY